MQLTTDYVVALAPDASSAKAAAKLAIPASWQNLGRNDAALWGECHGSALYKVRVNLADTTASCSCPSRKFPCKHGLALMLLAAQQADALQPKPPPEWVTEWLARRQSAQTKRADTAPAPQSAARRATQAQKTAAARAAKVEKGLAGLNLWLGDLLRNGLAGLELKPHSFWEDQAARMTDAQAPGIAARLRAMAAIPNASPDWPERLLAELGRLALLSEAYSNIEHLDEPLAETVRQLIGWTLSESEVLERGEAVTDQWLVLGERTTHQDRLRVRRTWLLGIQSQRTATVVQFAAGKAGFAETFFSGMTQTATAVYWPGAVAQRALLDERKALQRFCGALPGAGGVEDFLAAVAGELARQPWLEEFVCLLHAVVPVLEGDRWLVVEADGTAIPLTPGPHWELLALSGAVGVDLAGVWNGRSLSPLGVASDGRYYVLPEEHA